MIQPDYWNGDQFDAEAQRLYEAGDYEAALEVLKRAIEEHPESPELHITLGFTRLAREEFAWAHGAFSIALWHDPEHEEALAGIGEAKLRLGDRAGAFRAFDVLLELGFDTDAELMLCVGRSLLREGLPDRAIRFFRLARRADPLSAEVALDMAFAANGQGEPALALDWSYEALRLDPEFAEARALSGNILYERGEFTAALEQFERIPPTRITDPAVAWRVIELKRRVYDLPESSAAVRPYLLVLEELATEPSPEDRLLAEIEAAAQGRRTTWPAGQLDLFGRPPEIAQEGVHRVRVSDGSVFEGDWETIVRNMRDLTDPTQSVRDFMRAEAGRLNQLTGGLVSFESPQAFIEDSARVGALEIER
ncbi:MAG: tetratricopeptide repeat protein [Gemmatimonadota bacterium]|nr:tetratricopeptide repeat protein [Gemmatimonadota bacterium]